jgi:hypothetical protein
MKTAYATIKGFEIMRMFKKGQFKIWIYLLLCMPMQSLALTKGNLIKNWSLAVLTS